MSFATAVYKFFKQDGDTPGKLASEIRKLTPADRSELEHLLRKNGFDID